MSKAKLFVKRFVIGKSGGFIYDQVFHKGVNIIRGENGTGKSTIMDLLNYALGAVITEWTVEQLLCDWVIVEVGINGVEFCLKRDITKTGQEKMQIFEGEMESALKLQTEWLQYPMRRSKDKHSYSQQLFELLGLPRHKTDDEKNLTMHQILRLMYVDQLSSTTKLLKEDANYDNLTFRKAIGEYLLGIDDLEAHNLRQELLLANKTFEKLNAELQAIYKMFGNDVSLINNQALNNEIDKFVLKITQLKEDRNNIHKTERDQLDKDVQVKVSALMEVIDSTSNKKIELEEERSSISIELVDTKLFLDSLHHRKSALENSKNIYSELGEVSFKYCPVCLVPIENDNENCCSLCKSEKHAADKDVAYIQLLNELNFQIKESDFLTGKFQENLDEINGELPSINRKLGSAKTEYQELEITASSKDALLAEVSTEIGYYKSQIVSFEEKRGYVNKVERLRENKESANSRILEIEDDLKLITKRQAQRYSDVYESIEEIAKRLLVKDGGYENEFDNVEDVVFDFAKDKMYVNGRNKYSASSMVVMKNSIRLAVFLHAVQDNYSRLPNILFMDNIEDKGMVDARSQNFQHLIVEECESLQNDYQLIFTTSMIAPDLNNTPMCVGPMYLKGSHTLEFHSKAH
ncbi:MAG: hypothetical protein QM484_14340 [Woeseiaceae bacterium]